MASLFVTSFASDLVGLRMEGASASEAILRREDFLIDPEDVVRSGRGLGEPDSGESAGTTRGACTSCINIEEEEDEEDDEDDDEDEDEGASAAGVVCS